MLAAVVNLARFLQVDPEKALGGSCDRFVARYAAMENYAAAEGRELASLSLEEQDALWERAKAELKNT